MSPAEHVIRSPRTVLVSSSSVDVGGGLAVYAHRLADRLAAEHGTATTIARVSKDGVPFRAYAHREAPRTKRTRSGVEIRIVAPSPALVPALRLLSRSIDRRALDRLTIGTAERAFAGPLDRAIPRDAEVVHFVGSAWELFGFAALEVARRRGIGFTTCPAIHPGQWGDSPLDARLLTRSDLVIALSAHEAATLGSLGVEPERICRSPLGPASSPDGDGARFRAAHALDGAPVVLFVGRKLAYKGYDALVAAVAIVREAISDATCVVIGSGDDRAPRAAGLLDLGAADEQTKADALAACDVFCMPSSGEAFGMAYVEAWSYGKPVVVGPAPAARDLVEHGRTGLHAAQAASSIADALVTLLSQPALARRMGAEGRRVQLERYTWDAAWQAHCEGFTAAAARASARRP